MDNNKSNNSKVDYGYELTMEYFTHELDKYNIEYEVSYPHNEYASVKIGRPDGIYFSVDVFNATGNLFIRQVQDTPEGRWLWENGMPKFPLGMSMKSDSRIIISRAIGLKDKGEFKGLVKLDNSMWIIGRKVGCSSYIFGYELPGYIDLFIELDKWNKVRLPIVKKAFGLSNDMREMFLDILLGRLV